MGGTHEENAVGSQTPRASNLLEPAPVARTTIPTCTATYTTHGDAVLAAAGGSAPGRRGACAPVPPWSSPSTTGRRDEGHVGRAGSDGPARGTRWGRSTSQGPERSMGPVSASQGRNDHGAARRRGRTGSDG